MHSRAKSSDKQIKLTRKLQYKKITIKKMLIKTEETILKYRQPSITTAQVYLVQFGETAKLIDLTLHAITQTEEHSVLIFSSKYFNALVR